MAELGTALAVVAFADQCLKYGNKFVKTCKSYLHAEQESVEYTYLGSGSRKTVQNDRKISQLTESTQSRQLISIEINWLKLETQIGILKRVAAAGQLSEALIDMQSHVLSQLKGKLKTASLIINQLMTETQEDKHRAKNDPKHVILNRDGADITKMMKGLSDMRAFTKIKYVSKKTALIEIVEEIEKWQARYDPSWILIMQMSSKHIDDELEQQGRKPKCEQIPIIIAAKGIRDASKAGLDAKFRDQGSVWISDEEIDLKPKPIHHSSIEITDIDDKKRMLLIDTMISNPAANVNNTTKEVRNLARILAEVDPSTFGLLKCRGVIKIPKKNTLRPQFDFKFIFDIPAQLSNPQSLRAVLLSEVSYPLDERLELAKKLTSSVLFVHTVQFVHKNIRPETIVVFQNGHSSIGAPYLAGFEKFRIEDGNTYLVGDSLWDHNLYRHPSRQGTLPEMHYQMQHDIYSLGVVLLEIGLWSSFSLPLASHNSSSHNSSSTTSPNPLFFPDASPPSHSRSKNPLGPPSRIKAHLESLAIAELPSRLGKRYTDIVLLCLRCLDEHSGSENDDCGDGFGFGIGGEGEEIMDEDGIVIGVKYIENVLLKMLEIII